MKTLQSLLAVCCVSASAVLNSAAANSEAAIRLDEQRGELEVTCGGKPVLTYAFAKNQIKPYVRSLYVASGLNVLRDSPADHLHHHALMYAIRVNGVNFWEEAKDPGHEISVKLLSHKAGRNAAGLPEAQFSQLIHWVAHTNAGLADTRPAALLIETRTITVTLDGDEVAVVWSGDFEVGPAAETVKLHGSSYNGLGLRLPKEFDHVALRQNSESAAYSVEGKSDLTPGRWTSVTGTTDGREATAVLFANPANKGRTLFFSMLNPFTYLAVTQNLEKEPLEYRAGERFSVKYLMTAYPGKKDASVLNKRYEKLLN